MSDLFSESRWPEIASLGAKAGAGEEAIRKWRERRRVPGEWHWPIVRLVPEEEREKLADELLSTTNRKEVA